MTAFGTLVAPGVVRFERLLSGPIERFWDYLTDPERRARWLAGGRPRSPSSSTPSATTCA